MKKIIFILSILLLISTSCAKYEHDTIFKVYFTDGSSEAAHKVILSNSKNNNSTYGIYLSGNGCLYTLDKSEPIYCGVRKYEILKHEVKKIK